MKSNGLITSPLRSVVSEWEDNILFDADDPDFRPAGPVGSTATASSVLNADMIKVPSNMSIADMHKPSSYLSRNSLSMSSSLSDLVSGSPFDMSSATNDNVLTIEELRAHMGSCFTCGVSWTDDHVSLDCSECGGYSSQRPCLLCDGQCASVWKRDYSMSHACGKARWQGHCLGLPESHLNTAFTSINPLQLHNHLHHHNLPTVSSVLNQAQTCGASQFLAQELCARLEQLSASAQT